MHPLKYLKKSGMGSTTKFIVFNFSPYESITILLHKKIQLNASPPPKDGMWGRKVNAYNTIQK